MTTLIVVVGLLYIAKNEFLPSLTLKSMIVKGLSLFTGPKNG